MILFFNTQPKQNRYLNNPTHWNVPVLDQFEKKGTVGDGDNMYGHSF